MSEQTLTGTRKAAVMLIQMGKERSAKVMAQMRDSEVEEITAEIVRLQSVDRDTADEVLDEFHEIISARRYAGEGGMGFARGMLESTVGPVKAAEIMSRLSAAMLDAPFKFLTRADPRQVLSFLRDEHPQTIALVLAHVPSENASSILSGLASDLQADVAHRIAVMDRTSPEIVKQVESTLERRLSSVLTPTDFAAAGGLKPLVEIINRTDRATERLILEGLEGLDPALAEEVRSRMFMFEDIINLEDRAIQLVLRSVEPADLATALKGVRDDVRDKVMRNLSERASENLADEIEMLGAVRLTSVEEAQAKVVQGIRSLEESGQIVVRRGGDDEYVS